MGNSSTKEQRAEARRPRELDSRGFSSPGLSGPNSPANAPPAESSSQHMYSSRMGRGSRPDLTAFLGLGNSSDSTHTLESRRETKQEREARKLEKDRLGRLKERERSMRDEHVDGGYLVTQGVYTGIEDFDKRIVRQLMIERRLAPFWRGLNDHDDSWTENQLIAAAKGLPIPAPDEIPEGEEAAPVVDTDQGRDLQAAESDRNLTVPITSRSPSYGSDSSSRNLGLTQQLTPPDFSHMNTNPGIFRGRSKTLASLTTSSKHNSEAIIPAEMKLPNDPNINGQRIEVFLYKDTFECPICLIYYPAYGNKTRCCDQWICSECFVQIKRPDPHPPEHVDPAAPAAPTPQAAEFGEGLGEGEQGEQGELVSEPATCPFCKQAEFGITYEPPPFRRGLAYVNQPSSRQVGKGASAMSSSTSLSSGVSGGQLSPVNFSRRRTTSVSATDSSVITTDRIRPDWHQKLMSARAHASRRSAAATALHTAAYLMGDRGYGEGRGFGPFNRRGILRRSSGPEMPPGGNTPAHASMMALLSERHAAGTLNRIDGHEWTPTGPGAPTRGSSRRPRMEDIEDMMMMEAIRLSLASEEERHKQEEKMAKKESKKAEKEAKKKDKAARKAEKAGLYLHSANQSTTGLSSLSESSLAAAESSSSAAGKGKAAQRSGAGGFSRRDISPRERGMPQRSETDITTQNHPFIYDTQADAQTHLEQARAQLKPELPISSIPFSSMFRPSHLRTTSNVSSSASSVNELAPGSSRNPFQGSSSSLEPSPSASGVNLAQASSSSEGVISGTPPGGGAGLEPMFNFRSLAEMVGTDEGAIEHGPVRSVEEDEEVHQRGGGADDDDPAVAAAETERSDSMATVQRGDEFHDTAEYPQWKPNRNSLNEQTSRDATKEESGTEGQRTDRGMMVS
ncbi:MAG: hypothetical protein Q9219_001585 [cf. Caloplaca sp. 3 TL-2023]